MRLRRDRRRSRPHTPPSSKTEIIEWLSTDAPGSLYPSLLKREYVVIEDKEFHQLPTCLPPWWFIRRLVVREGVQPPPFPRPAVQYETKFGNAGLLPPPSWALHVFGRTVHLAEEIVTGCSSGMQFHPEARDDLVPVPSRLPCDGGRMLKSGRQVPESAAALKGICSHLAHVLGRRMGLRLTKHRFALVLPPSPAGGNKPGIYMRHYRSLFHFFIHNISLG